MGNGMNWALGMASNWGGEPSLELLELVFAARLTKGIGEKELDEFGTVCSFVWSLLLERDLKGHFLDFS